MTKLEQNELRRKAAAIIKESFGERNDRQTRNDLAERLATLLSEALLQESQESKSISQAAQLILDRGIKKTKEDADKFVRVDFRGQIPALRDKNAGKFILGAVRMWIEGQLNSAAVISRLNTTLKFVADPTHINEYDRNLNGLSAQELIDRFAPARQQAADQDKQALSGQQYQKNKRYKIHKINSFEEARKYGKYNDWCLAQPNGEDMYNQYTADGVNQLYIIVRDDYKTVPKQTGENTPYDDYGLSMMTVIVDGEGHMTQSTTRWNHQNGSSDSALTTKQVSEILGLNFYDTFKPNDTLKKRMEAFDAWLKGQGEKPEGLRIMTALSDNSRIVYFNKKYNIIRPDNTLLLKHWLDYINQTPFSSGLILVIDNDNYNLMDPQTGEMACTEGYDYIASHEYHGFLLVEKEGQNNFIRPDGTLLSNQWFDYADPFTGRFAKVQTQGKGFNLLTTDGKLLSGQWFRAIDQPNSEGFAPVQTLDAPVKSWQTDYDNILRPDGTLLFKEPVDQTFQYEGDWFKVVKDGKQNLVTKDGRLLSQEWFDKIWPNRDDDNLWAKVEKDGKQNIVRPNGSLLSPSLWFDSIFTQGQSIDTPMIASTGGKFNFIAPDGKPVYPRWFDSLDWFRGRYAECRLDGRHGYIDRSGKFYPSRPEESAAERPAGLNETRRIELLRRLVESGKESLYERYKNDQRFRFKATALLAKAGYAVHGTQSRFETFSQDHINGGSRSVYGHGFYFTTEAYKAEEFGLGGEYVFAKISDMALLDLDSPLPEGFEDVCETDMRLREYYSRLENMLDDPAHRGQLTRIWDEMKEVEEGLENLYGSEAERQFYQLLHAALTNYSSSAQAGHIMMHVCKHFPNAFGGEKFVSRMMLSLGYDGWRSGAEIVIWNADKLNANIVRDKDKLLAQILRGGED